MVKRVIEVKKKKKKKKSGDASWCDVCFRWADGSCSLEVKHFLRTVLFPPHLKSEQSEGPWRVWPKYHHPSSPLRAHTHTHTQAPAKLCKKAIQQIWPSQHKRLALFWHFPDISCFFFSPPLSMWVRPRDKPLNKYQVIKLHQPFVIRVFCLIPNCSWIFLMLSW